MSKTRETSPGGQPEAPDPFPWVRTLVLVRRLPVYAGLAWRLAGDERVPAARRAALVAAAAYLVSPIDLVPGIIPVLGQLDDLVVVLAALHAALSGLTPEQRVEHLQRAGLAEGELAGDLATLAEVARWLARHGLHAGERALHATFAAASWVAGRTVRAGRAGAFVLSSRIRAHRPRR